MPVFRLTDEILFPPPALAEPDGLLAVGGDLQEERLLLAYSLGIFPWYNEGDPILWWSPEPRLVLIPEEFHISRSLERVLKSGSFNVTFDTSFEQVIHACAAMRGPGREDTWITREMLEAYCALHKAGYAHSVETWRDGELSGGLYGIALGGNFFGESMFSAVSNASKVALARLVALLRHWDFSVIDCQVKTNHLVSLGAREISRAEFQALLHKGMAGESHRGSWQGALATGDG